MILSFKLFETASDIKGYYISEDEDEDEDDYYPVDINELVDMSNKLTINCGIRVSSAKDLIYVFYDIKFKKVVAALYRDVIGSYSFDIVVDRSYENVGLATKLVKIAIDDYRMYKEGNQDLAMEIDCINPIMADILERKFGFKETGRYIGGRRIMTKTFD
jgi:ribosomal protein S18 acetylase RimI-like enzyme